MRTRQISQGVHSASSQAKSKVTRTKDQGGVGCTGGNQSSSHHKRTDQGQESFSSSGPLRPPPSATVTSGTLAANSSGQGSGGATGQSGQGKRQPGERDRSVDKKVRYFFCWSIENWCLHVCLNPCDGFSDEFFKNYFIILKIFFFQT